MIIISAIAVIGKNRELGCENKLLWDIPDDLRHFKEITSGSPVIMGRKTFESIGHPLPGRANIIITRDKDYKVDGCEVVNSLEDAIETAKKNTFVIPNAERNPLNAKISTDKRFLADARNDKKNHKEIFIIGGGQIYKQALPYYDKLYLTIVEDNPKADIYFPDYSEFKNIATSEKKEYNGIRYTFQEFKRIET